MKPTLLCTLLLTAPLFAGTPVMSKAPIAPPPAEPCLFTWFAGGSVGYLTEFEEAMYHAHFGTDTCWSLGGWDIALFAEIGYTRKSESFAFARRISTAPQLASPPPEVPSFSSTGLDGVFSTLAANSQTGTSSYRLAIMPITANIKFERPITNEFGVYVGAGLGVANVDFKASVDNFRFSDDDWVFVAQIFAGGVYKFNPSFEMYGGARWIYLDDASFTSNGNSTKMKMDDDFLLEIGARFKF